MQALALQHHGRGEHAEQPLHERVGIVGAERQHGELVAAQPGHGVRGAQRMTQALAADLEQTVARGVAQGIVDLLEVVQVEERDDGGRFRCEHLRDPLLEQRAVRQPGEGVGERERLQLVVAHTPAAGTIEQREQRGEPEDGDDEHGDGADPGDPVRARGEFVALLAGGVQAGGDAVEVDGIVELRRRARTRALAAGRTPP